MYEYYSYINRSQCGNLLCIFSDISVDKQTEELENVKREEKNTMNRVEVNRPKIK